MTVRVKWGVIGSGGIARRRTIPEGILAADNAELGAVFDVNQAANTEVARAFGARPATTLEELLRTDVQAVYIATPVSLHAEQAVLAACAGKHVLCEKPLGLTPADTDRMVAASAAARVRLGTALMMRFHSQHQAALRLVRDGRLGRLTYGRAQLSCWYPPIPGAWRQDPELGGGGALMDLGGHCIDLLEMFFGPVATVSCFTRNQVHAYPAEDSAIAMLSFASGAMGTVDTCFCIPDNSSRNVLEIYGSQGSILAQGTIGQGVSGEMTAFLEEAAHEYDATQARAAGGGLTIQPSPVNLYRAEIEEFSQAILDKREPTNSAELGVRSQKILNACYRSARNGRAEQVA